MNSSTDTGPRLVKAIVLAVLATAIAVPVAQAKGSTGKSGPLDPWAYGLVHRSTASTNGPLDPWAYGLVHRSQPSGRPPAVAAEITTGLAAPGSLHPSPIPGKASVRGGEPGGFDWSDAGIGAGVAFGAVLLVAGTALGLRKRGALAHIHL
jgi:hypothetical protein